jgi:hypothetical protein
MKTVEQLLELSKNPYYTFTNDEKAVLDDFLSNQKADHSTSSTKKKKSNSDKSTNVRVRNIVTKTMPKTKKAFEPEDADETR